MCAVRDSRAQQSACKRTEDDAAEPSSMEIGIVYFVEFWYVNPYLVRNPC
ncbi:hypothetical protein ANDA3_3672 [plant metagenome]|uniref:Uncharacterized protein n=1 Tax=plant metagenome TaxID=1297885 RepID=A0A484QC84_9ZZZZ